MKRSSRVVVMGLPLVAALVVARGWAVAAPAAATAAPVAAGPAPAQQLLGDFVEMGPVTRGISRDQALVQLVNKTTAPVDVVLGEGSARVEAGASLLATVHVGEVAFTASAPGHPDDRLEASLHVERGTRYAVVVTRGVGPPPDGTAAASGTPPAPTGVRTASPGPASPGRTGRQHVDIGRKRKGER